MLWIKTCNIAALSLAFIFAACGGDSGSNASNDDVNSSVITPFFRGSSKAHPLTAPPVTPST